MRLGRKSTLRDTEMGILREKFEDALAEGEYDIELKNLSNNDLMLLHLGITQGCMKCVEANALDDAHRLRDLGSEILEQSPGFVEDLRGMKEELDKSPVSVEKNRPSVTRLGTWWNETSIGQKFDALDSATWFLQFVIIVTYAAFSFGEIAGISEIPSSMVIALGVAIALLGCGMLSSICYTAGVKAMAKKARDMERGTE